MGPGRRLAAVLALAAGLAPPGAAAAPIDAVRSGLTRAERVIASQADHDAKLASLRTIARGLLDTRTMGRRALGSAFEEQPEALREEFLDLFDALMVRSWLQRLLLFREPRFDYPGERVAGDRALVHTRILTEHDAFAVDYEMLRSGDRWQAIDVVIEGISQTRNYRSQFERLLRNGSFPELLDRMRRKVTTLARKDAS